VVLTACPFKVEGEETFEDVIVGELVGPAVGVEDGVVELLVGEVEPGGALVVQVGERALLEYGIAGAIGIEGFQACL